MCTNNQDYFTNTNRKCNSIIFIEKESENCFYKYVGMSLSDHICFNQPLKTASPQSTPISSYLTLVNITSLFTYR